MAFTDDRFDLGDRFVYQLGQLRKVFVIPNKPMIGGPAQIAHRLLIIGAGQFGQMSQASPVQYPETVKNNSAYHSLSIHIPTITKNTPATATGVS